MKLVFATNNKNKLLEVQEMLPKSIQILGLRDINCFKEIDETALTLEGNAELKATYVSDNFVVDCFADDTGLEVESLSGKPGVYSARFAGTPHDPEKNMQKLLTDLEPFRQRRAQFRTIICLHLQNEKILFEGICKGEILMKKKGLQGFGYDPIFKPNGFKQSFGEMNATEKNIISHRGIAIQKLVNFLKERFTTIE
jgi:XTP/dITP diphosphohydrolase